MGVWEVKAFNFITAFQNRTGSGLYGEVDSLSSG